MLVTEVTLTKNGVNVPVDFEITYENPSAGPGELFQLITFKESIQISGDDEFHIARRWK